MIFYLARVSNQTQTVMKDGIYTQLDNDTSLDYEIFNHRIVLLHQRFYTFTKMLYVFSKIFQVIQCTSPFHLLWRNKYIVSRSCHSLYDLTFDDVPGNFRWEHISLTFKQTQFQYLANMLLIKVIFYENVTFLFKMNICCDIYTYFFHTVLKKSLKFQLTNAS